MRHESTASVSTLPIRPLLKTYLVHHNTVCDEVALISVKKQSRDAMERIRVGMETKTIVFALERVDGAKAGHRCVETISIQNKQQTRLPHIKSALWVE